MTKLSNKQLKKLYDYGGTLSPKDWADLIDSIPDGSETPTYDDSGTIIKTTYEEAKTLYESGKMIPGVKYKFEYKHNVIALYNSPNNEIVAGIKNEFFIQVYIDRNGQLKAIGSYTLDNIKRDFVADFSFKDDIVFINTHNGILYDSIQYNITSNIEILEFDKNNIEMLTDFLISNNIPYSLETYETEFGIVKSFTFTLSKGFRVWVDDNDFSTEYICLPNGACIEIHYDNDYQMTLYNGDATISHVGLHNLNFGTFKHSHVIEGYFYDINVSDILVPSIVEANVHNDIFIPFVALVNISSGDIINTTFTYIVPEEIFSDQVDTYAIDNIYTNNNNIELYFNTSGENIDIPSLIMNTLDENNPYKFAYGDTVVVERPVEG